MVNEAAAPVTTLCRLNVKSDADDLRAYMREHGPEILAGKMPPIYCTVDGYANDPRELFEIPEVRDLARRCWETGLVSLMHVNLMERRPELLGSWDIYALANGLIKAPSSLTRPGGGLRKTVGFQLRREDIDAFFESLKDANHVCTKALVLRKEGSPVAATKWTSKEDAIQVFIEEALRPCAEDIFKLGKRGQVAVVVFDVVPPITDMARVLGWDGRTNPACVALTRKGSRGLATADPITKRWTERTDGVRVLLLTSKATFLLNFNEARGWHFEPGSLDSERGASKEATPNAWMIPFPVARGRT